MKLAQQYVMTSLQQEYKKQMLTAAHAGQAVDAKNLLDVIDQARLKALAAEAALERPTPAPPAARPSANVLTDGCLEISHKFNCVLIWVVFVSGSLIMSRKVRDPQCGVFVRSS